MMHFGKKILIFFSSFSTRLYLIRLGQNFYLPITLFTTRWCYIAGNTNSVTASFCESVLEPRWEFKKYIYYFFSYNHNLNVVLLVTYLLSVLSYVLQLRFQIICKGNTNVSISTYLSIYLSVCQSVGYFTVSVFQVSGLSELPSRSGESSGTKSLSCGLHTHTTHQNITGRKIFPLRYRLCFNHPPCSNAWCQKDKSVLESPGLEQVGFRF